MNHLLKQAMQVSRTTRPLPNELPRILAAEQTIAQMTAAELAGLQRELERTPSDAFRHLWNGLALAQRGEHAAACNAFLRASELGCNNWRVGWYLAQSAKAVGELPLVDAACDGVLRANPEFWFARELPKHARGFYAQGEHDRVIEQFFQQHPPRARVFVEVGAFDGVHYSNVRRLVEQHGWSGVSVEPVTKNFRKLCDSYRGRNVRCVQACASDADGEFELNVSTYPHLPEWGSDVASVSGEDAERWRKQYGAVWTKEKVPARRLTRILDEAGITEVDLLSVDAEGHDLEVLRGFDFTRFQPQLIVVEYGKHRDAIASFLQQQGYALQLDNQQDLFMARPAAAKPSARRATIKHYTGATGRPGYEEIQRDVEERLHKFIERPAASVERIVIVGGYLGHEVHSFLRNFPKAEIHIFEPSRRYFTKLADTYRHEPRVRCHPLAVGEQNGRFTFHEGTLHGVGSLLPLKTRADEQTWLPENFHPAENYEVEVVALDTFEPLRGQAIDLLWCDVQGAELKVLRGATDTLSRTASLFLEVATTRTTYEGQCLLGELESFAAKHGFRLAGLGLCPSGNGTGNGLWLRAATVQPPLIVGEYGKRREANLNLLTEQGYTMTSDNEQDLFMARQKASAGLGSVPVSKRGVSATSGRATSLAELHERVFRHDTGKQKNSFGNTFGGNRLYQGFERVQVKGQRSTEHRLRVYRLREFLRPSDRLLDIGCNSGFLAMSVADAVKEVTGFDADPALINIANEVKDYLELRNCAFTAQTFDRFDRSARFDVICSFAVHFWIGLPFGRYVDLLWDMLNDGGRLIFESHDLVAGDKDIALKLETLRQKGLVTLHEGRYREEGDYERAFFILEKPARPSVNPVAGVDDASPARLAKLNPHLLKIIPADRFGGEREMSATALLTSERFDIAAKYLYGQHREWGVANVWACRLYAEHLRAFNNFTEGDGSGKDSLEKFVDSFHATLDSIKRAGFDPGLSLVAAALGRVVIDGGHRVAACLVHRQPVRCMEVDFTPQDYNYEFFRARGLACEFGDAMALEFIRLNPELRLVAVPEVRSSQAMQFLARHGAIWYSKTITLTERGRANLERLLQADASDNPGAGAVHLFVVHFRQPATATTVLAELRNTCGQQAVQITASAGHTVQIAGIVCNENGLNFLNHFSEVNLPEFEARLHELAGWLRAQGISAEQICLDDTAVLAAYGLCDTGELQFLHHGPGAWESTPGAIRSQNDEARHHGLSPAEIIFDPAHHFWFAGFKFTALPLVRSFKSRRWTIRDQEDVLAIHKLLGLPAPENLSPEVRVIPRGAAGIITRQGMAFSNDWFNTHEPHWNKHLVNWSKGRGPINLLEIGSYEGRSACWFLTRIMGDPLSRLTCVDPWLQRVGSKVYPDDMRDVFDLFGRNIRATGRQAQVSTLRGYSSAVLSGHPSASYDLIYVDGDHSAEGVRADTLEAFRLLRPGGLLLWDDYYWADSVKQGVDQACAELGIVPVRLGNNASYTKPWPAFKSTKPGAKIVALVPARNEGVKIAFCFRALARFVDAIVYLDDCSDDGETLPIVEAIAAECRVERIARKPRWHRDEPGDRNALLQAGREIGGTHFVVIDADEAFTANCMEGEALRRKILDLNPGDRLAMTWIQLWRGVHQYRFDGSVWTNNIKPIIFCDDGRCAYSSEFIHTPRVPDNLRGRNLKIEGYQFGLLHFQFVNWRNLLLKQAWYRCIERVREPQKPVAEINARYAPSKDETNLGLKPAPVPWLAGYSFFDATVFDAPDRWRENQVLGWFQEHGREFFRELDIWDVDWNSAAALSVQPSTTIRMAEPLDLADSFVALADQEFTAGRLAAARDHLERAVDVAPERADFLIALTNLEFQLGNVPAAIQHINAAVALKPGDADALVLLASLSLRQEDVSGFERALSEALRIAPEHVGALRLLADVNFQQERWPDAAKTYFRLLNANATDIDATLALGVCFFKTGDAATARMMFERVLELSPGHALAAENLKALANPHPTASTTAAEETPLISAIISTYNGERFMRACLEDLEAQTIASRMEILVIDSGSPQNERAVVEEFQQRFANIRYVRTERETIYAAWNRGVEMARGKYLTNANTDDRHRPDALAKMVAALEARPDCALAYADVAICENVHPDNGYPEIRGYFRWPEFDAQLLFRGCYMGPQPVWRRDVHQGHGLFDATMKSAGDYEFWLRLALTEKFLHVPEVLGIYWDTPDSAGQMNPQLTRNEADEARRRYWPAKWGALPPFDLRCTESARPVQRVERRAAEASAKLKTATANGIAAFTTGTPPAAVVSDGPLISICIPTFNRERQLEASIQSALKQSYRNFEVVVVDDGSTDGTPAMMQKLVSDRVRYVRKEHSGAAATRNRCVAEARGEFILWLDSDDLLLPRALEHYVAAHRREPDVDVFYGNLQLANEQLVPGGIQTYRNYHGWQDALVSDLVLENQIPNGGSMLRTARIRELGGYNPKLVRAEDYEFYTRLAGKCSVRYVNEVVGVYRLREGAPTSQESQIDSECEASVVKAMLARNSLRQLIPWCFSAGLTHAEGEAAACRIVALLLLKCGDSAGAREWIKRSVAFATNPISERLKWLLDGMYAPGGKTERTSTVSIDGEFENVVALAVREFRAGRAREAARACTRLTDLRPEAMETLLLVGASLLRWGDPRNGRAALRSLVHQQVEAAYVNAADVEAIAPPIFANDSERRWHDYAAEALGVTNIPVAAIARTVDFICQTASATNPRAELAGHRAGLTPLFFALLGLDDSRAAELVGSGFVAQLRAVRAALPFATGPAAKGTDRRPGYSFCIITGGKRPVKLRQQIDSIRALGFPDCEIIVGGRITQAFDGVQLLDLADAADTGRTSVMRNAVASAATREHIVFCDDDLIFAPDFVRGLERFGEGYDAMALRLTSPDGSRLWDWACVGGARGQVLLNYWESNPDVYLTSGVLVVKAHVFDLVQWDEQRGYYEGEDVDYTRRLQAAGCLIAFNPFARVTHNDDRYTVVGRKVMRLDDVLKRLEAACHANEAAAAVPLLDAAQRLLANHPDEAETLRRLRERHQKFLEQAAAATPRRVAAEVTRRSSDPAKASPPPHVGGYGGSKERSTVSVVWDGSFLDLGSLSHVNRELTRALGVHDDVRLTRLGKNVVPKPLKGMKAIVDCARQLRAQPPQPAQVTVRHAWPPNWEAPTSGAWVLIQPWEFGALPKEWVHNLSRVDEAWVPSEYVRRVYVDSGVDAAKVHVVPNGIDQEVFRPDVMPMRLATKKSFKFLFVGGTILRKGPDVLLKAYLEAFTAADDVCLVIKDFGGQSVYAGQTFEAQVKAAQSKPNAPEILYLNDELPPESLPGLYAACDALVHPYRGEGFGLPILEAMACGLPVVVTAGGAADDFATDEFAYRLPSIRRAFGQSVSGMELVKSGWMLEPDHTALVERMKWLATHRDEAKAKGCIASEHVRREWTWERAAQKAAARLQFVASRTPKVSAPVTSCKPVSIELPPCGRLGHLAEARQLFQSGKLLPAWSAVVGALKVRPFHPEAFLLLAEIAQGAGDSKRAKELVERTRQMAPNWKPARKFAKGGAAKNAAPRLDLPALPLFLEPAGSKRHIPRLSVFVITKNEEKFIGRCLESVRDLAAQIVVLDTGSTDWTKTIAERFGAEVHSFDWCDDFSAARNAALERVTGDWVLMLDADEELLPDQKDRLRALLADDSAIAFRLPMHDKGREAQGEHFVPRLFRNAPGLFYVGRIHEQVFSSVEVRRQEWGLENKFGDAVLLHHGYTKEMVASRDKIARNLRLLRLAVEELPDEPNLLMNLGLELVRNGQLDAGLEQYAAAFTAMAALPKAQVTPELRESLLTQFASHLVSAKRPAEAVRVLESQLAKSGGLTASMHWLLGLACIEQKHYVEGAAQMRECLAKRDRKVFTPVDGNILKGGPHHCLGLCLAAMNQIAPADRAFHAALEAEPDSRRIRFDYARFLTEGGHEVEALKYLHQLVAEDASEVPVWIFGGHLALRRPEFFEFANDWTGESYKLHSTHPIVAEQRATALLFNGDADGALAVWRQADGAPSASRTAAMRLCEVLGGGAVAPVSDREMPEVGREFLQWYRRLLAANAGRLVGVLHERLERLRPVLPEVVRLIAGAVEEANAVPVK